LSCGLKVEEIPNFRTSECPNDIQHYFIEVGVGE